MGSANYEAVRNWLGIREVTLPPSLFPATWHEIIEVTQLHSDWNPWRQISPVDMEWLQMPHFHCQPSSSFPKLTSLILLEMELSKLWGYYPNINLPTGLILSPPCCPRAHLWLQSFFHHCRGKRSCDSARCCWVANLIGSNEPGLLWQRWELQYQGHTFSCPITSHSKKVIYVRILLPYH